MRPIMCVLPEVSAPDRKVSFKERMGWTLGMMILFVWASNTRLYGVPSGLASSMPSDIMRIVLASGHGTVMDLGITPIITSSMAMQLLAGAHIIDVNQSMKEDRALFGGAQKLFGILLTLAEAVAFVVSGMYGPLSALGAGNAILIVCQLFLMGVMLILMDQVLQKGWGIGSGVSLFMCANICSTVWWKTFSWVSVTTARGVEKEGAFFAIFHLLLTRPDKLRALKDVFFRTGLPNLVNLAATAAVAMAVIYFQKWRIELPVKSQKYRGQEGRFPIKLFYTSNMPLILQSALVANLYMISQLVNDRSSSSILIRLLGQWEEMDGYPGKSVPVGGIAYYITPPATLSNVFTDPFHSIFYLTFVLMSCAIFSKAWMEVSGSASLDVARQLREQQMVMKGHRDTALHHVLDRYIPPAAAFGGMCIGALTVAADLFGAVGSGTGIIMAVTIIHQYTEIFMQEQKELMGASAF
ncbi:unnamed protein product [Ectocarpus sp. 6 AP-2014]